MWPKMAFQLAEVQKQLLKPKPNGTITVMEQVRRERIAISECSSHNRDV